jgi:hypothetical protein
MLIDGKIIKCSTWKTFSVEMMTSLVVVFTQTRGDPPSYKQIKMFRRAQCAGEAFADVWGEAYPVIFAIPRAKVSSQNAFFGKDQTPEGDAGVSPPELWAILKAAQVGRTVYLVCVGVDAFTTNIDNYLIIWPTSMHTSKLRLFSSSQSISRRPKRCYRLPIREFDMMLSHFQLLTPLLMMNRR